MTQSYHTRSLKILEMVPKNNVSQPNSSSSPKDKNVPYYKPSETINEDICLCPTYQLDETKTERTANWILDNEFGKIEAGESNAEERTQKTEKPVELRPPTPAIAFTSELEHNTRKTFTVMRKFIDSKNDNSSIAETQNLFENIHEISKERNSSVLCQSTSNSSPLPEPEHNRDLSSDDSGSIVEASDESSTFPYGDTICVTREYVDSLNNTSNIEKENVPENIQRTTQPKSAEQCSQPEIVKGGSQNSNYLYIEEALSRQKKKRTVCKFCRINVTNFERHLSRHHLEEKEVKDFLKFPKTTKEGKQMRRNILALLRYEVKFENFVQNEEYNGEKLPCSHCKRIVGVQYLRRHYKKCIVKPFNYTGRKVRHRAASQTMIACASEQSNVTATLRVKNEVFSRMASDEIGFLARMDPLIRHFGVFYLKKHKRSQISLVCSNKMRECSRLLLEMRRRTGNSKFSFFEMLDPILFDEVVLSAKAISGFDEEKKTYKAPSLAMHLGTTLQQICDLTTHLLLKETPGFKCENLEDTLKRTKRFRFLVQSQWSNEVSSLALKDLAEKKWNKPVLLPLTEDIMKFRDHISDTANKSVSLLNNDQTNAQAYKKLVDAALALTILFNRRRIGDVQYVEIDSYLNNFTANDQTELLEQLSESEKTLTSSYKRIVAGGKGSRAIVILFPSNVQEYINLLLEIRRTSDIVPPQNRYLFAYPKITNQWIRGDIVLKNFAKSSKIQNPEVMTSNRLRKQIATLMQIINLNKQDYSQFSKFMGHTEKTHKEFYEITQNAYQTAKIAKLLNLFDKGKGAEYRNMTLECIDIDPRNVLVESDNNSENEKDTLPKSTCLSVVDGEDTPLENMQVCAIDGNGEAGPSGNKTEPNIKKTSNRIRWTTEQKKL